MRSPPYTKSCPLTSSRLSNESSSAAYGARFDRKRIHTDVSTRTIMPPSVWLMTVVHAVVEFRGLQAPSREERANARKLRAGPVPLIPGERRPYPSSLPKPTWRRAATGHQCAASSSCHTIMPYKYGTSMVFDAVACTARVSQARKVNGFWDPCRSELSGARSGGTPDGNRIKQRRALGVEPWAHFDLWPENQSLVRIRLEHRPHRKAGAVGIACRRKVHPI